MHPKEFKEEKAATGRLTHLCLSNSEIATGVAFGEDDRVTELMRDDRNFCALLYPGPTALNLSRETADGVEVAKLREHLRGKTLVVFVLDGTWALARKMLRLSPALQTLPRVMFTPATPSRYLIKQQPVAGCLATIEAVHELLIALEKARLDVYPDPEQLLRVFAEMQDFQIACARDPQRAGYRRAEYKPPAERKPVSGRSGKRRTRVFQ